MLQQSNKEGFNHSYDVFRRLGWKTTMPMNPVANKIMTENIIVKKNLLLTRFLAEIGEA